MRQLSPVGQIERGAQAGIEPATAAWVTQHIGSAASGTEQIHTCALECGNVTLSADPVS